MKSLAVYTILVALALGMVGCRSDNGPAAKAMALQPSPNQPTEAVTPGLELLPERLSASLQPTGTPEPTQQRLRPYPAPTGYPAFRRYYQIRCYPGCHYGATSSAGSAAVTPAAQPRLHRSYPAPTGVAGFRRYYQIRCYPGCHSYDASAPVPTVIHP